MHNRAHWICDFTSRKPELQPAPPECFPSQWLPEDVVKKTLSRRPHPTAPSESTGEDPMGILCLPYVQGLQREAGESMHSPWGQGSLQASQDPQANPDASQDPHSGREEERSGLRGSM